MNRFIFLLSLNLAAPLFCSSALGNQTYDYSVHTHWSGSHLNDGDDITSVELIENFGIDYVVSTGLISGLSFFILGEGGLQHISSLSLPGFEQAVSFQSGAAYVVSEPDLLVKVFCYSPESPVLRWLEQLPHTPVDIATWGQYVVIACGQDGLLVFDTTEQFGFPTGVVSQWTGTADQVEVVGDYALVRNGAGITSIDLSDPSAPETADIVAVDAPADLLTDSDRAFVGAPEGILELNMADPSAMFTVRTIAMDGEYNTNYLSLALDGNILYVVNSGFFRFLDLMSGTLTMKCEGFSYPEQSAVIDGQMAMAAGSHGLFSYSLEPGGTAPSSEIAGLQVNGNRLKIVGDRLFSSAYRYTYCYDIGGPQPALLWSHLGPENHVASFVIRGNMVYIGFTDGTMDILDIQGTQVGFLDTGTWSIDDLRLTKNSLAVWTKSDDISYEQQLQLYDLGEPTTPQLADVYQTDLYSDMLTAGNTVVLYDRIQPASNGGLLLDASDPQEIVVASPIWVDPTWFVSAGDSSLYLVQRWEGPPTMFIMDVSDPFAPQHAPEIKIPSYSLTFLVDGDAGYLGSTNLVFDLSDPLAPRPVGAIPVQNSSPARTIGAGDGKILVSSGGYFLMSAHGYGLSPVVEDLPDPTGLALKGYPNPFSPMVTVEFTMETDGRAVVEVYDVRGHLIDRIAGSFAAGTRQMEWNGRDPHGRELSSGVYFLRVQTPRGLASRKILLAK
ncbi:MAG: T9SS type A sorting domain-containing protein [bacterium]|nr:T9SS type A sorting domain-containing protein [bacterium]